MCVPLKLLRSSSMCVPLTVRGKTIGAISLASAESQRLYNANDLSAFEELGRRAALAIDNAKLYESACVAARAREEFLSIASHELKTPLTVLRLELQNLERTLGKDHVDALGAARPRVAKSLEEGRKLDRLIDELLDVSRLTSGKLLLAREEMDLTSLARMAVERFEGTILGGRGLIKLKAEGPVFGRWDSLRIEQVLTNLLSNAVKYGKGNPIRVEVSQRGSLARLAVRDEGIGISQDLLGRIFRPFERGNPPGISEGLGLGLYIAKMIIEAHGGTIGVETVSGAGSTLTVELPTMPIPEGAGQETRRERSGVSGA
jgi:signal transduction histidine kinase